ncbi:MAG: hypothetical protein FRX49_07927 [Trebouxia sp. A1-2]|nr:MAG: hypothetical protein FRX49_07927 [Trebouxia sp. A1-2]
MDTVGHDASSLSGVLLPLLLCADDLIIMSMTAAWLQRQLDALQHFCHQRQLSVNLAKPKMLTFESKAACQAFVFNSNKVERVESYKCTPVPVSDPELRCKIFDSLLMAIFELCRQSVGC